MSEIEGLPNWPVVKHLTYREAHLFIQGSYIGISIPLYYIFGDVGAAASLLTFVHQYLKGDEQKKNAADLLEGWIRDAWYLVGGLIIGIIIGSIIVLLLSSLKII